MTEFRTTLLACALALPLLAFTGAPAATAATTAATTATAVPADASGMAADGNYWVWADTNRGGPACGWSGNDADWRTCGSSNSYNMNDRASSWWNNGYSGALGDVRVYEDINYGGASTCAPNGSAGNIPWEWNDRISSHKWVTNCGF